MNYKGNLSTKIINAIISTTKYHGGVFSRYYQITNTKGIKVLKGRYVSDSNAKLSSSYAIAHLETTNLKIAKERFYYIPECYGVIIIKIKHKYAVGIIMEHVGSVTLMEYQNEYPVDSNAVLEKLQKQLRRNKIQHNDLHESNVMYHKHNWYVIDFGINGIEFI